MADNDYRIELKDPNSDYVAVVGTPGQAANLQQAGWTVVESAAEPVPAPEPPPVPSTPAPDPAPQGTRRPVLDTKKN